ncbi:Sec-independent protein translocase protein TatB [Sphingomonas sp. M1-B02]|uniref:Sec-independent protein translocase protein TatB n=1 Tax=Sphingomonas sp. M1-B02 TaxID=3114300 RepID=UPI00223FA7A2|nr:Sec-independent protein translocase protein TatB [Sphingomonas sp. S6-11]UZK67370.1 Sec-independent protein translocase protein TatB [Sphingomonas sp. S6-11]
MLDVAPTELLLVAVVALLVIGPKDLPKAMRFVGQWVGKARGVARQFRAGMDTMMRESELAEMEKQWAAENERIMREHPSPSPALPAPQPEQFAASADQEADAGPLMVEQPAFKDDEPPAAAPKPKRVRKPKVVAAAVVEGDPQP